MDLKGKKANVITISFHTVVKTLVISQLLCSTLFKNMLYNIQYHEVLQLNPGHKKGTMKSNNKTMVVLDYRSKATLILQYTTVKLCYYR